MNERESRREALEDMIRISEEAGLYEDEITVDEHLDAVDRARKLIHMREAQASTNLDGETIDILGPSSVDWQATAMRYIELNSQKTEAISRVRELHIQESEITTFCKECSFMYPCDTIKALDGEQ